MADDAICVTQVQLQKSEYCGKTMKNLNTVSLKIRMLL